VSVRFLAKRLPIIFQSVTCTYSSAREGSAFPVQLYSFIKIVTTSTSLRSGSGSGCEKFQAAVAAAAAERSKRQRKHTTVATLKALSAVILHSRRRIATRFPNHLRQNRSSSSLARAICRCHALHTGRVAAWRLLAVTAICSPYHPYTLQHYSVHFTCIQTHTDTAQPAARASPRRCVSRAGTCSSSITRSSSSGGGGSSSSSSSSGGGITACGVGCTLSTYSWLTLRHFSFTCLALATSC
jgi:uncharacterized membrane protein YgcG